MALCPSHMSLSVPKPGKFPESEFRCLKTVCGGGGDAGDKSSCLESSSLGGFPQTDLKKGCGVRQGLQRLGGVDDCDVPLRAGARATSVDGPESRYLQLWGP